MSFMLVRSFTCSGMTPTKYTNFSKLGLELLVLVTSGKASLLQYLFAEIMHIVFHSVYKDLGYAQVVAGLAEECMREAVEEVKALRHYSTEGEVCM